MSKPSNRHKGIPKHIREQVAADMRCPDCPSVVRLGFRADGEMEAVVDHAATCPAVPEHHRERGELRYTTSPVIVRVPLDTEGNN